MSADEIKALEQRLTDAGCYKGAIDGTASRALDEAIKACPDQRPFLRIDTGMHTAMINRIGVDAACRVSPRRPTTRPCGCGRFPTASSKRACASRSARGTWGRTYKQLCRLTGIGSPRVAVRQEGTLMGNTGFGLSTLQAARFVASLHLTVPSPTLRFLLMAGASAFELWGNNGVRVLDIISGTELLADRDYGDAVYGLAFAPDGMLVTSSLDGELRRYGPDSN